MTPLTAKEVAARARVSLRTFRRHLSTGDLGLRSAAIKCTSRKALFDEEKLDRYFTVQQKLRQKQPV